MKAYCLLLVLLAAPAFAAYDGWHWYKDPKQEKPLKKANPNVAPDLSAMTPTQQAKVLKELTQQALNKAILYPSSENTATYLRWQQFWTDKASSFSQSFALAQLNNPELDYNLKYSHYNGVAPLQQAKDQQLETQAIKSLSQRYGLFFFYNGKSPLDVKMAEVVADFAKRHAVSLIPISVDGKITSSLPQSRINEGQAQRLGVRYFPAIFLVNPKEKDTQPLAYGFMTQDDLARRFLAVATHFKPNS